MSAERTEEFSSKPPVRIDIQMSDGAQGARGNDDAAHDKPPDDAATGEDGAKKADGARAKDSKPPRKEVSEGKVRMQSRLPALDDDADVGIEKEHIVTRDDKADLAFMGTLRASAAPSSAPKGHWDEYRIYETSSGKHVFSKASRSIFAEDADTCEAEVFDPAPSSVSSQLLRGAREIARSRPLTWMDAAVAFFGYDPLAKALYRKLSVRFEEIIT
jgi:hypothetical protein